MKMIHRMTAILLCGILLLAAGCGKSVELPEKPATGLPKAPGETTNPRLEDASLVSLRQAMIETPQLFAVAYFGYHDTIDSDAPVDPYAVMREQAPELCKDLPFLLEIPADQVIGNHGDLFCIVPLDENAMVSVGKGRWHEKSEQYLYEESLYFRESGEPILVFCNGEGWEPDTQVCISGPSGEVIWYPQADDNLCAMPLRNDNWDDLFLDVSPYRELLLAEYRSMNGEWTKPTSEMLTGTTWIWERYLKDGREVSYRLTFAEDTLSVRWNDGIDEEDHEYPDAAWELTDEEGFAVLSIDFREFAGVLRYDLMYHEEFELLYVGMDVVQEEMPIGWEPLYRYLGEPEPPEPVEMLGDWELEWTEVEGYREYVDPGIENISVFLRDDSSIRLTHVDNVFYENSIYDKEVLFYEGELYFGCGNDRWVAYLGNMDGYATTYSFTLTDHDQLLMQLYWEIDDGVPMVAYKMFHRVSEYND